MSESKAKLKTTGLYVLVEPELRAAIEAARGKRSMGRFVRDVLRSALGMTREVDGRALRYPDPKRKRAKELPE